MRSPFPPRKKWGQHFLADPAAARRIVEAVRVAPGEVVVEIGPGDGALTRGLAARGARLLAVEIDPRRAAALVLEFAGNSDVSIETGDALDRSIGERLAERSLPPPAAVVGNLPYNVATPILRRAVAERDAVSRVVATVQKEVAQRFAARPGSDAYGYLSVWSALSCEAEILFDLPAGAFRPRPKVTSSVLRLVPKPAPGPEALEALDLASRAFAARRKTLANAVGGGPDRNRWIAALAAIGKPPTARAEELSAADFVALARAAREAKPHPPTPSPASAQGAACRERSAAGAAGPGGEGEQGGRR